MDEQAKPKTPAFQNVPTADMWPQAKPHDEIGNKIKSYIKDINKLIAAGGEAEEEDEEEDDENIEEVPSVPFTDET